MARLVVVLAFALLSAVFCFADEEELVHPIKLPDTNDSASSFGRDVEQGKLAERTDGALDGMLRLAVKELKRRGHSKDASRILKDWENKYSGWLVGARRGVGDHEAIPWLLDVHNKVHDVLGETLCSLLRFHDLWYLAYTIPVVFRCVDFVDEPEYRLHFVPFCGIVAYWGSNITCIAATFGVGYMWICSPIAMVVEFAVKKAVAPPLSPKAWQAACN
jgi:hypothetical protein